MISGRDSGAVLSAPEAVADDKPRGKIPPILISIHVKSLILKGKRRLKLEIEFNDIDFSSRMPFLNEA
jgi:hypothetical protein